MEDLFAEDVVDDATVNLHGDGDPPHGQEKTVECSNHPEDVEGDDAPAV